MSLWGVKVGDQGVAWWAVCHRGRLSLWGWIAVGAWMIFGVGYDTCVFSEIGFWSSLNVLSLGGRLLNPTKPLYAWTEKIITSNPCSTSNPTTQSNERNHEESQTKQNDNQWPRFLVMEATDKKHSIESKCIYTEKGSWQAWQMDVLNNVNQWNLAASLLKWRKSIKSKISWGQQC